MATRIALRESVELDLPGRRSREILSGKTGAGCTFRIVDIDVPAPDAPERSPHWHPDSEECIHVLSGTGLTWVEGQTYPMQAGDTIHIAPGERHVTRNTGDTTLTLLCFFPEPAFTLETDTQAADVS